MYKNRRGNLSVRLSGYLTENNEEEPIDNIETNLMNRELQDYGQILRELRVKHLRMASQTKIKKIQELNLMNKSRGV